MIEPRTIVAIDCATVSGVAEVEPGAKPRFYSVRFASPGDEHPETFKRALVWIARRLAIGDVAAVYLEAPLRMGAASGQTNADTVLRLNGLWAVISAAAKSRGVRYRDVSVQDARRVFIGERGLRREEAKERAMRMAHLIGWDPNNLDEADAAAVLLYALTKEAPDYAPVITPLMHHQIATAAENERILRDREKRERGLRRRA